MPAGEAELVAAQLLELSPAGIEERELEGQVELAVYTDAAGEAAVAALFPDATTMQVAGGWEDAWKEFHRPTRAGGLWIGPPWLEPPSGEMTVVVDPGRAFGTGAHATTRACIELLELQPRGSVLDAGCGSGVVAVAAARLGFTPDVAVDADEVAVAISRETARHNEVSVDVRVADVLADDLPAADVVVANIELSVVESLLARVVARRVVTSGYLAAETPSTPGWEHVERLVLNDWAADVWSGRH